MKTAPKPIPQLSESDAFRFWSRVDKTPGQGRDGDCWQWVPKRYVKGYGLFWAQGATRRAHRVAYMLGKGENPGTLLVCHTCDNRICCNPDHLFLGTIEDNNHDMLVKDRYARGETNGARKHRERMPRGDTNGARLHPERMSRGEHRYNAKLTNSLVVEIRNRYAQGDITLKALAQIYELGKSTIYRAIKREGWKHVP